MHLTKYLHCLYALPVITQLATDVIKECWGIHWLSVTTNQHDNILFSRIQYIYETQGDKIRRKEKRAFSVNVIYSPIFLFVTPLEYLPRYVSSDGDILRGRIKAYHIKRKVCVL